MTEKRSLDDILSNIQIDLATVKTDVSWLKKLFVIAIIATGAIFGVDISGVVV